MAIELSINKDDICAGIDCAIFIQKLQLLSGESTEQEADIGLCDPNNLAQRVEILEDSNCINCRITKLMKWLPQVGGVVFLPMDNNDGRCLD